MLFKDVLLLFPAGAKWEVPRQQPYCRNSKTCFYTHSNSRL